MTHPLNLSSPADLKKRCIALATLDAILSPEWEYRYFSFNSAWAPGFQMASMRDGSGTEYFILFYPDGSVAIKGFTPDFNPGDSDPFQGMPEKFDEDFRKEAAFSMKDVTFILWHEGSGWGGHLSPEILEVAEDLLENIVGGVKEYLAFASDVHVRELDEVLVQRVFNLEPLTLEMARGINPEADISKLCEELKELGYPNSDEVD